MPSVSMKRIQRGSVHRSICGPRAVVMPRARYSFEASSANWRTTSGSPQAAKPTPSGHLLTSLPALLNSALAGLAPLRGSEEMLTGMAKGSFSASRCRALLQRAAVPAVSTAIIRMWRMWSPARKRFCWSESAWAGWPDSSQRLPSKVPVNGPPARGGTIWCGEYSIRPAISSMLSREARSSARSRALSRQSS